MSEKEKDKNKDHGGDEHESAGSLSWAKKILTVGVGTLFLTEEALRTLVTEFKLPKEVVSSLLDGATKVRKEFMQNIIVEMMSKISDKVDPSTMMADFFKKNDVTFEVKIKVKDKPAADV
ncbi:MAG: hypothetical protein H7333_00680 [Bdellovibrionales bacterium]|nr:hypothetical protein [Oligoflexia bacterium]